MALLTQAHNQTTRSPLFRHMQMPSPRQHKSLRTTAPRTSYHTHPSVRMPLKSRFLSQHPWPFKMLDKRSLTLRQKSNRSSRSRLTIFLVWLFMYARLALFLLSHVPLFQRLGLSSLFCFNNNKNSIAQVLYHSILSLTPFITVSDTLLPPMAITLPRPIFNPSSRSHHIL